MLDGMIKRILVLNSFRSFNGNSQYLLSCDLLDGNIAVGEVIYFGDEEIGRITNIDGYSEYNGVINCAIGINDFNSKKYKLFDLYGKVLIAK